MNWLLNTLTLIAMLIGLMGLIIPIFPGGIIIGLVAVVYALFVGLNGWGLFLFILIMVLAIGSALADNVIMGAKAHEAGGAPRSIFIAVIVSIIVSIFLTPLVGLAAAPVGLFAAEYNRTRDRDAALKVTKALMLGWGWAFVARFGLGIVKIVLWAIWAWSI